MNLFLRTGVAAAISIAAVATRAVAASADTSTLTSGTEQRVIVEPVCNGELAPVTYTDDWHTQTITLPTGGVHLDLAQHGSVAWSQDGITYTGTFSQSQSQNYAAQDVLRDDLTVEASGSDGSHVHAWVRIIGQIRDGQPHLDQWSVAINC